MYVRRCVWRYGGCHRIDEVWVDEASLKGWPGETIHDSARVPQNEFASGISPDLSWRNYVSLNAGKLINLEHSLVVRKHMTCMFLYFIDTRDSVDSGLYIYIYIYIEYFSGLFIESASIQDIWYRYLSDIADIYYKIHSPCVFEHLFVFKKYTSLSLCTGGLCDFKIWSTKFKNIAILFLKTCARENIYVLYIIAIFSLRIVTNIDIKSASSYSSKIYVHITANFLQNV